MQPNDGMKGPLLNQGEIRGEFLQLGFSPKTRGCFGPQPHMVMKRAYKWGVTALTTYNITGMILLVTPITNR